MMRYGVIVCPKCKISKIVDLSYKTTRCNRCSATLTLSKVKILYRSDSQQELRSLIGGIDRGK